MQIVNLMGLLIIDFDDTLIDNTNLDLDSFRYIAKTHNLANIEDNVIIKWRKNGMLARNILKRLLKNQKDTSLNDCIKIRLEYLKRSDGGINLAKIRLGVRSTLHEIKKRGYFIAVITSRENKTIVEKIIKNLQLSGYIDNIYCASDIQNNKINLKDCIELKKHLYELALQEYLPKIKKQKVVAIGNLKADIIAAKKLKIKPIAIKGSYRYDSGISKLAKTIENFQEVLNIL